MDSRFSEKRSYTQLWTHKGNKFVIGTLHGTPIEIVAQYNPKELARQAAATWDTHPNTSAKHSPTGAGNMWSEYKTTAPRTVTLELLFDGYEEGISVTPIVESLESLTIPVDMSSHDATKRRPQLCVAVWGTQQLRCVVTSVATKLTMFDESGEPLRASCTVVLSEVDVAAMMKVDDSAVKKISQKGGGYEHRLRDHSKSPYPPEDSKPTRVPRTSDPTASDTSSAAGLRSSSRESSPAGTTAAPKSATPPPAPAAAAPASPPAAATPAPASPPATGTPSAQVDPNAMDGEGDHVFVGEQPAEKTGTPSKHVDPNAMDGQSDVFGENPPAKTATSEEKPDAVSGADSGTADPKYKAAAEDML